MSFKVCYLTENKLMTSHGNKSLLEICLQNKIPISHSCEGMASCGTCRVLVLDGLDQFESRNPLEREMAVDRGFKPLERLACQIYPKAALDFILPED